MRTLLQALLFFMLAVQFCFAQWYEQNSGTNRNLNSVQFIDLNNGFAVGDTGTILNTPDRGTTWKAQISGTVSDIQDVFFIDSSKGWAVGSTRYSSLNEGIVLFTSDAGMNWTTLWTRENVGLNSIYFIDSLRGWVVGDTVLQYWDPISEMWCTTDGGVTWSIQYKGEYYTSLNSVYFIDSNDGWAVGDINSSSANAPILHTTNGGNDWIDLSYNFQTMVAYTTHFSDVNNGWIVGSAAYKTIDGGISWVKNDSLEGRYQANSDVQFFTPTNGWVVGCTQGPAWLNGFIAHTTDGGNIWSILRLDSTAFYSCDFVDSLTGWVVGENGIILHTTNGGVTFVEEGQNSEIPTDFLLSQNYPNPFNPNTKIKYSVPQTSQIQIKVFDVLGNEIEALVNEEKPAGTYELTWDAANLPSGVYFYQLKAGNYIETKKMNLLK